MNLRQKAKKYKRELEMIKGMPVKVSVIDFTSSKLRHLRIKKRIDPEFEYYCYREKTGEDYINKIVANDLIDQLKYYVVRDRIDGSYSLEVWVKEGD